MLQFPAVCQQFRQRIVFLRFAKQFATNGFSNLRNFVFGFHEAKIPISQYPKDLCFSTAIASEQNMKRSGYAIDF